MAGRPRGDILVSTYNTTTVEMRCARCGTTEIFEVAIYGGYTADVRQVSLGEPYPLRAVDEQLAVPELVTFRAYTECPACCRDFHCLATLSRGILDSVRPDLHEPPLIADSERAAPFPCPVCGAMENRLQAFNGYAVGRFICDHEGCSCHRYVDFDAEGRPQSLRERSDSPWSFADV